jgi:methylated-DNA-[protein]-cysteine S-methyltransferase
MHIETLDSPIGELTLVSDGEALTGLYMTEQRHRPELPTAPAGDDPVLAETRRQLAEYFSGARREFDLPLRPAGTQFQQTVWAALREIPYGETAGYGELAARIGRPGAARAVGLANGRNPIAIVVPCHRVIGSGGSLTGYGGGLERKRYLLSLEGAA